MWKIIAKDNYNREIYDEWLVADNISNLEFGELMTKALNDKEGDDSNWYYHLVDVDYVLFKREA